MRYTLITVALTFVLQMATIYIPFLHPIFKTQTLTWWELALCIGLAMLIWVAVEIEKAWRRMSGRAPTKEPKAA